MNFKTTFSLDKSVLQLNYSDSFFFIGSCFSQNISSKLLERKFSCISNPFGVVYNPISIFKNLDDILDNKSFSESNLFCHNEVWSCFDFHSDMSALSPDKVLSTIHFNIKNSLKALKKAKVVFITFGTAWVYEQQKIDKTSTIVSNCHKMPSSNFVKRHLTVQEIVAKGEETIKKLLGINKNLQIVFTLSPVRHLKDGFVENNLSKSLLNVAIHELISKQKKCSYFPSYELVIDDLRDYRFFKKDLVHPNDMAIDYVFEQFTAHFFSDKTIQKLEEIEKLLSMLSHKVNFKETKSFEKFQQKILKSIELLESQGFDFSKEKSKILN